MTNGGEHNVGGPSNVQDTETEEPTRIQGLSEETISTLSQKRHELESNIIDTFNGKEMWYQERRLQFQGVPKITTDDWGVTIQFESKSFRTICLSGRWDVIIARPYGLSAHYAGWTLSFDCQYPEIGTSYG